MNIQSNFEKSLDRWSVKLVVSQFLAPMPSDMEELSGDPGQALDVGGVRLPARLEGLESRRGVRFRGHGLDQGQGVIQGLGTALGEVLQHRVCGVADQGDGRAPRS